MGDRSIILFLLFIADNAGLIECIGKCFLFSTNICVNLCLFCLTLAFIICLWRNLNISSKSSNVLNNLFIIFLYYHFNICRICSDVSAFIFHVGNLCLLFYFWSESLEIHLFYWFSLRISFCFIEFFYCFSVLYFIYFS